MSFATAGSVSPPSEAEPRRPGGPVRRTWVDRILDPVRWEPGHERLAALPVFAACSRADVRVLARAGDECFVPSGTVLCREGRIGYWLFVVTSGSVQLRTGAGAGAGAGAGGPMATLRAGSHFGEVAIIGFGPQPVTAVVAEDATVFVLGRRYVLDLVHSMPGFRSGLFPGVVSDGEFRGVVRELRADGMAAWSALPRQAVDELLAGDRVEQLPPTLVAVPARARTVAPGASPFAAALRAGSSPGAAGPVARAAQPLDRRLVAGAVGAVLAAVVAFALLFHPDVLVVRPSRSIDVSGDVAVAAPGTGIELHPPRGRYIVTAVDIEEVNVVGLVWAVVHGDEVVRRAHDDVPGTISDPEAGRASYRSSQRLAAALVARRAGVDPSSGRVQFRDRGLTGPSAGLLYALVLADMADVVSVPPGRVVAATGELDAGGRVRAVGFVPVKRQVARAAGATVFLVPPGSVSGGRGGGGGAISVATLDEALAAVGS